MASQVGNKAEIFTRIRQAKHQLAALGVKSIGLFGSFVRGEQNPASDVDILVEFVPGKHTFDNFMEVSFFLEKLLGRKVEIVTPESLSPYIGPHILKEVERVDVAA
jgi:predicted nucleotidyltransferase